MASSGSKAIMQSGRSSSRLLVDRLISILSTREIRVADLNTRLYGGSHPCKGWTKSPSLK
jgi:hypothetical protein